MPRKYTKKKGGAERKNTTSSTGRSSRPTSRGSSSTPDSGNGKSKKKKESVTVLNLTLAPKKSVAELALESRKKIIIEGLKRMTNKHADEIFSKVEIIPGLEVKIYDNTNIELFLREKKKELKLEYFEGKKESFGIYIAEFKEILAESGRVIAEVIKPDKIPYKYFYKSSGTSRDGTNLAGYYLPLDKTPIANFDQRFKKPEDEFIYSKNEKNYSAGDGITLESMETYKRFMNEMNASICKTLYSGLNIFGVSK